MLCQNTRPERWQSSAEYLSGQSSITTEGLKSADVLKVRIYDLDVKVKKDDVIMQGYFSKKINTIKDLDGCEYFKVITANYNRFGSIIHKKRHTGFII